MFENISSLYAQYNQFLRGEPYVFLHSTYQLENWAFKKVNEIENESIVSNSHKLLNKFSEQSGDIIG